MNHNNSNSTKSKLGAALAALLQGIGVIFTAVVLLVSEGGNWNIGPALQVLFVFAICKFLAILFALPRRAWISIALTVLLGIFEQIYTASAWNRIMGPVWLPITMCAGLFGILILGLTQYYAWVTLRNIRGFFSNLWHNRKKVVVRRVAEEAPAVAEEAPAVAEEAPALVEVDAPEIGEEFWLNLLESEEPDPHRD